MLRGMSDFWRDGLSAQTVNVESREEKDGVKIDENEQSTCSLYIPLERKQLSNQS